MDLKRILQLLTELEAQDKVVGLTLPTLYDPNGDIMLTVRATDVATREQFLADVAGTVDEAEPVTGKFVSTGVGITAPPWSPTTPHAKATVAAKSASKKASKKAK